MAKQSIQYALKSAVLTGENDSDRTYMTGIKNFAKWAKENGLKKFADLEEKSMDERKAIVQSWECDLEESGKSPSTIHTYLAPICKGLGMQLDAVEKPKRASEVMTKGRNQESNQQGKKELYDPKYARLVEFQKAVGLRRSEIKGLTSKDLKIAKGEVYVHVFGKGGKEQFQAVLPEDRDLVCRIMSSPIGADGKVFSSAEMTNKIDLHSIRAEQARRAYAYYTDQLQKDPRTRVEYVRKMSDYFKAMNMGQPQKAFENHYKRFREDILANGGKYVLRGENARKAQNKGLPTTYDRVALMMVSVFHLAHWRNDVTVINYMVR